MVRVASAFSLAINPRPDQAIGVLEETVRALHLDLHLIAVDRCRPIGLVCHLSSSAGQGENIVGYAAVTISGDATPPLCADRPLSAVPAADRPAQTA